MLNIRFCNSPAAKLTYSIERLGDGLKFDFGDGTFKAAPATPTAPLPEVPIVVDGVTYDGQYALTLTPTPDAQFTNGHYAIAVYDTVNKAVVGDLATFMVDGDDKPGFANLKGQLADLKGQLADLTQVFGQGLAEVIAEFRKPKSFNFGLFPAQ